MRKNLYDRIAEKMEGMTGRAVDVVVNQFKGANQFNKVPVSPKEQLLEYAEFTPDKEAMMRQYLGNEAVDSYKMRMETLRQRYQK